MVHWIWKFKNRNGFEYSGRTGGLSFSLVYTIVLLVVGLVCPNFYEHRNLDVLSNRWFLSAPVEEYLFAFTFGVLWAPLYEAWRDERQPASRATRPLGLIPVRESQTLSVIGKHGSDIVW